MRLSIRWKLILSITLPLLVIYAAIVIVTGLQLNRRAYERMQADMTERVAQYAALFDAHLDRAAQVARSTAALLSLHSDLSEQDLYDLLRRDVQASPLVYGACIAFEPGALDPARRLVAPYVYRRENKLRTRDIAASYDYTQTKWEWYAAAREAGKAVWTEPYYDEGGGNILMCTYSAPFHREGKMRGVATVDIPITTLQDNPGLRRLIGGSFVLLSRTGRFISHPQPEYIMNKTAFDVAAKVEQGAGEIAKRMTAGQSGSSRFIDFRARAPAWVFYAPIRSAGWSLAAAYPESELTAFIDAQRKTGFMVMLGGLVVILGMVLFVASRLSRPMVRLSRAVRELGEGRLDMPDVSIDYNDEIGDLARAFNAMVKELRAQVDALTRETAAREAVESEMRIGRQIQKSLLPGKSPPFPDHREFELHAVNAPARHVAGDFFDYFFVSENVLAFVIADVSGKGVPAALLMAVTRTLIRDLADGNRGPGEVLDRANRLLYEDNANSMFVTLFLGQYNTRTGEIVYANAGHPPPYRIGRDRRVSQFGEPTGMILGVVQDEKFEQRTELIEPGEALVLFTDGVPEAQSPSSGMYGEARFEQLLATHGDQPPPRLCELIIGEVDAFQAGRRSDDITLLVLRRTV